MSAPENRDPLFRASWADVAIIAVLIVSALLGRGYAMVNL